MAADVYFEHTAFDDPANQIRFVKIQSPRESNHAGAIHLSLSVHDFKNSADAPPYTALSYTWGPPTPTRDVILNGKTFKIRENLWHFLNTIHLRSTEKGPDLEDRYVWIDQLCIDQSNRHEKGHQVNMMAEIFTRAETVLVWLGLAGEDSKHARIYINAQKQKTYFSISSISSTTPENRQNAAKLLQRPYWTRLWVMQELALARSLVFLCGNWTFVWDDLIRFSGLDGANEWVASCYGALTMAQSQRPLLEVIRNFHSPSGDTGSGFLLCENRLDKIYGLMGLVIPNERIDVDYASSPDTIVLQIASQIVKSLVLKDAAKNMDTDETQAPLKMAEDAIWASCNALGIDWPQGLDLQQEWEIHMQTKRTFTDIVRRQLQSAYDWF